MLARVVTLRSEPRLETLDDGLLQEIMGAREVFAIRERFGVCNASAKPPDGGMRRVMARLHHDWGTR